MDLLCFLDNWTEDKNPYTPFYRQVHISFWCTIGLEPSILWHLICIHENGYCLLNELIWIIFTVALLSDVWRCVCEVKCDFPGICCCYCCCYYRIQWKEQNSFQNFFFACGKKPLKSCWTLHIFIYDRWILLQIWFAWMSIAHSIWKIKNNEPLRQRMSKFFSFATELQT